MPDDTWAIWTSSGEYQETAESAIVAAAQYMTRRPDDYIAAIVCDGMQPPLVPADNASAPSAPVAGIQRMLQHLAPAAKAQKSHRDNYRPTPNEERTGHPGAWHRYDAKYMAYCHAIGVVLLMHGGEMFFTPDFAAEFGQKWMDERWESIHC